VGQFEIKIAAQIIMAEKSNKKTDLTDHKTLIKHAKQVIKDSENLILQLKASIKATENLLVEQRRYLAETESEYEKSKS
jgi:hypothetical protein